MPQVVTNKPDSLKPYLSHGLILNWSKGDKEAIGDCPWCGKEGKFSVNLTSGLWRCFSCNEGTEKGELVRGGNALVFLRKLHEVSFNATSVDDYKTLTQERKLLYPETFVEWQLAKSILTDKWILPGYNIEGSMTGLYRYLHDGKRWIWFPTPTMGHHLFGMNLFSPSKPDIYVMEGLWDGATLWETFVALKETEGSGYVPTANREVSLSATRNVVAIPTCSVFYEHWLPLFSDKRVILGLDNDHPRKNEKTGAQIPSGAMENTKRIAKMMAEYESPPAQINFIRWGDEGYNLELPHSLDVRSVLTSTERVL